MKVLSIVLLLILWSGLAFSKSSPPPAWNIIKDPKYKEIHGATKIIKNMPRIRSQDSLGVCFGFSAATIAQKNYVIMIKNQQQLVQKHHLKNRFHLLVWWLGLKTPMKIPLKKFL